MANKTIQQLIASGALVGSTTFETQLAGGGASQFGTLTQLLTFIQSAATQFTQSTVFFGNGHLLSLSDDGSALFANGHITFANDGSALFANGVFTISSTGDVEITDTTKGYILKSPNGTRYRIKVSDVGVLTTQAA